MGKFTVVNQLLALVSYGLAIFSAVAIHDITYTLLLFIIGNLLSLHARIDEIDEKLEKFRR